MKARELLIASGVFDRFWYTAQCDKYFVDAESAAEHFVQFGMKDGYSPHPLIELSVWPKHLQEAWRRGDLHGVFNWFRRPPDEQHAAGPLFDSKLLSLPASAVASHPGGSVGWFIQNTADEEPFVTPFGTVDFGDVRRSWSPMVTTIKAQKYNARSRSTGSWDQRRELEWRQTVNEVALPNPTEDGPLFSVIMPSWNRQDVIARAIRSVQSQQLQSWELLVVDDGSSDATREVVRALAAGDGRIVLIEREHAGVSAARNSGLERARGRWVAFLDTDNVWPRDCLDLTAKGLLSSSAEAVHSGIELHNGGVVTYRAHEGGLDKLLVLNHIDLNVFALERALALEVGGFDESLRRWVDHDFAIRVARRTKPVFLPFIGCRYWDDRLEANRITTSEPDSWQWAVLGKNWVDWPLMQSRETVLNRVSVVIPTYQDWAMTARAAMKVLENSGDVDVDVIIVDNGSNAAHSIVLGQLFLRHPKVTYARLPRNMNFAIGSNYGAFLGTGEYTCLLNNDTEVRPNWLAPLLERLDDPFVRAVQPLLQYSDDSIQTAGTVFMAPRTLPGHFLTGLPPEDASGVGAEKFPAVTAAAMLCRTAEFAELRGFDPLFVNGMEDIDYCLRAASTFGGHFVVEPRSRVTHRESKTPGRGNNIPANRALFMDRWKDRLPPAEPEMYERHGFRLAHVGGDNALVPSPRPLLVRERNGRVRWGIRYSAIGGWHGDRWGDHHYVQSLSAALRTQGVDVATYRHGHNVERGMVFDDVNLVIRGLDVVTPIPGAVNVLWIISHPEDVSVQELRGYDLVFAASTVWSKQMTEETGVPVLPLLQATDTSVFHLPDGAITKSRPTTFVGANTYNRDRRVVKDALVAGIDLRLVGHGWESLVAPPIHEAEGIRNEDLGDYYRSSERVLADHWQGMAERGFIQNRIFDAVACGTPVVSDEVEGLDGLFGSMVQTYTEPMELGRLCSLPVDEVFGSIDERRAVALKVAELHSFDARASTLINAAEKFRRTW